ncbi:splicing factor 3A subunit 2-like [Vulpes lagopus]|uniref:splicing factor 3A subunit 2-like n=1 Tax=Vulpes lagopus TaxID=494514 RepID=UPI001BC8D833|nr:splicing factor 3A subunit 2-like [Vulpes lagopus]XP_041603200.1 splicing factor 3A subunit 2-like [Vulpes lagopus]
MLPYTRASAPTPRTSVHTPACALPPIHCPSRPGGTAPSAEGNKEQTNSPQRAWSPSVVPGRGETQAWPLPPWAASFSVPRPTDFTPEASISTCEGQREEGHSRLPCPHSPPAVPTAPGAVSTALGAIPTPQEPSPLPRSHPHCPRNHPHCPRSHPHCPGAVPTTPAAIPTAQEPSPLSRSRPHCPRSHPHCPGAIPTAQEPFPLPQEPSPLPQEPSPLPRNHPPCPPAVPTAPGAAVSRKQFVPAVGTSCSLAGLASGLPGEADGGRLAFSFKSILPAPSPEAPNPDQRLRAYRPPSVPHLPLPLPLWGQLGFHPFPTLV